MITPPHAAKDDESANLERLVQRILPRVLREQAEYQAECLWDELGKRYGLPKSERARFIADKTADFMRCITVKDRLDMVKMIRAELRHEGSEHRFPGMISRLTQMAAV